jgi:DNA-binding NtrC family response regulator/tetratricopeptide (TPR) repeat protein
VEGLLSKHLGHLGEAVQAFRRAAQIADCTGSLEQLCWSQLRLMGVSTDLDGPNLEASMLRELRSNTEKAAIPSVSTAHQIFLAEYHAKRGQLDASWHHSRIAESLLTNYPNVWLRGLLDLQMSCLGYLEGNFLDALVAARHALETADESGHLSTRLRSLVDMGAAYLAIGQPARAEACLSTALREANAEEEVYGLILETLAEVQLVVRDLDGCSASLERAREISARLAQARSAWHKSWNLRTEASLLQRRGKWKESLELIICARDGERKVPESYTRIQIEALEALALASLGEMQKAEQTIQRVFQRTFETPRISRGSFLYAAAVLSCAMGDNGDSLPYRANALRVLWHAGETSSLVEIVDRLVPSKDQESPFRLDTAGGESPGPLWRPTSVVCHLDTLSPVWSASAANDSHVVAFVNALPDLAMEPQALGEEALRCFGARDWVRAGTVHRITSDGERSMICSYAPSTSIAFGRCAGSDGQADVCLSLGTKQGARYELELWLQDSVHPLLQCNGLLRLLAVLLGSNEPASSKTRKTEVAQGEAARNDETGLFASPAMIALVASAERVAPLDITVLLTGESGTGKEVVANIIHRASGLPPGSFVAFNCANVPRDMVDSQLFGYRRGAFTGAVQSFKGVISAAEGGTLLLDEIGEMPLETQPKLLRFLDAGEVQALGEAVPRRVRVRVLAATNADLEELVEQGRFREDLFYRLNVVHFRIPPLRERREEIAPMLARFLQVYARDYRKYNVQLSDEAREHLLLCDWPGNVRQLSHEVRRLVALHDSDSVIEVRDLDNRLWKQRGATLPPIVDGPHALTVRIDKRLSETIREIEKAAITDAIAAASGRMDLAARRLGLSRKGLYLKRQRLGFDSQG